MYSRIHTWKRFIHSFIHSIQSWEHSLIKSPIITYPFIHFSSHWDTIRNRKYSLNESPIHAFIHSFIRTRQKSTIFFTVLCLRLRGIVVLTCACGCIYTGAKWRASRTSTQGQKNVHTRPEERPEQCAAQLIQRANGSRTTRHSPFHEERQEAVTREFAWTADDSIHLNKPSSQLALAQLCNQKH